MGTRIISILLAVSLTPALALAQRRPAPLDGGARVAPARVAPAQSAPGRVAPAHPGGGVVMAPPARGGSVVPVQSGLGMGISTGGLGRGFSPGGFSPGIAPPGGFGNINHPGLGFAPNTPGIGFPLNPGNHIVIRSNRPGFVDGRRHFDRDFDRRGRNTVIIGVPYAVPYYPYPYYNGYGLGYNQTMLDAYGNPVATTPVSPQPNVIVIAPNGYVGQAQQDTGAWGGPSRFEGSTTTAPGSGIMVYQPSATEAPEKAAKPLTLLVFKDHSIYAATDYWKQDGQLCYTTSYGSQNCVSLDQIDLDFTRKLNAERNVTFELPQ